MPGVRWDRGAALAGPGPAPEPELAHEPLGATPADRDPLAVEGPPDLAGAVDVAVVGEDAGDLGLELLVAQGAPAGRADLGGVVGGWGDRERLADRLDPKDALWAST